MPLTKEAFLHDVYEFAAAEDQNLVTNYSAELLASSPLGKAIGDTFENTFGNVEKIDVKGFVFTKFVSNGVPFVAVESETFANYLVAVTEAAARLGASITAERLSR